MLTPERLSDEHRLIAQTAEEFVDDEVMPGARAARTEGLDARAIARVSAAGELGLLGVDVPEEFGGVGLDKVAAVVVSERIGDSPRRSRRPSARRPASAITPILCFGTDDQKQRYLPQLVTGEMVGAYALSESGSGSDALGANARAVRQPDGSFVLNGEKMWITNGGFADVFIVFAKVGRRRALHAPSSSSARSPASASGKEEHKMGLHGSSTTPLILQDAQVPAANLLGEIGKGHKVAFNVLNFGRFKLGAMCSGGAQAAIGEARATPPSGGSSASRSRASARSSTSSAR